MPTEHAHMDADALVDALALQGTGSRKLDPAREWMIGRDPHPLELLAEMESAGVWGPSTVAKAREILADAGIADEGPAAITSTPDSVLGAPDPDPYPPPPVGEIDHASSIIMELQESLRTAYGEGDELKARIGRLEIQYDSLAHEVDEQTSIIENTSVVVKQLMDRLDTIVVPRNDQEPAATLATDPPATEGQ